MVSRVSLHEVLSVGANITASGIESTERRGMFGLLMNREMHMRTAAHGGYCRR